MILEANEYNISKKNNARRYRIRFTIYLTEELHMYNEQLLLLTEIEENLIRNPSRFAFLLSLLYL
jgi:hypothetical protein